MVLENFDILSTKKYNTTTNNYADQRKTAVTNTTTSTDARQFVNSITDARQFSVIMNSSGVLSRQNSDATGATTRTDASPYISVPTDFGATEANPTSSPSIGGSNTDWLTIGVVGLLGIGGIAIIASSMKR